MKPFLRAPLLSLLLLTACNSGNIRISSMTPEENSAAPSSAGTAEASTRSTTVNNPLIYFHRVSLKGGLPFKLIGVGYLNENASSQAAFGVRFPAPESLGHLPRIRPTPDSVTYLRSESGTMDGLFQLNPSTLENTEIARLPKGTLSYDVTGDLSQLAWVDSFGIVHVLARGEKIPRIIDLQGGPARSIELGSEPAEILIHLTHHLDVTESGLYDSTVKLKVTDLRMDPAKKLFGYPYASSPTGSKQATGIHHGNLNEIRITDDDQTVLSEIPVDAGQLSNLAWRDEKSVSFLLQSPSGHQRVMLADIETREVQLLADLNYNDSRNSRNLNVTCPVWHEGRLYFADWVGSTSSIYRAQNQGGQWNVELFARAGTENEGFICPASSSTRRSP